MNKFAEQNKRWGNITVGQVFDRLDDAEQRFKQGIRAVAGFMSQWDAQIDSPYRIEDIILCKFNIRKGKPRKKSIKSDTDKLEIDKLENFMLLSKILENEKDALLDINKRHFPLRNRRPYKNTTKHDNCRARFFKTFDAWACLDHNVWTETRCTNAADCKFCVKRPKRPFIKR